jgi:hypothetical protein
LHLLILTLLIIFPSGFLITVSMLAKFSNLKRVTAIALGISGCDTHVRGVVASLRSVTEIKCQLP